MFFTLVVSIDIFVTHPSVLGVMHVSSGSTTPVHILIL